MESAVVEVEVEVEAEAGRSSKSRVGAVGASRYKNENAGYQQLHNIASKVKKQRACRSIQMQWLEAYRLQQTKWRQARSLVSMRTNMWKRSDGRESQYRARGGLMVKASRRMTRQRLT